MERAAFPGCKTEEVKDYYSNSNTMRMLMRILAILHLPLWVLLTNVPKL